MRWKQKYIRIVKRFAFLPIEIDGEYRWFEIVYIEKRYSEMAMFNWCNYCFVTRDDYIRYKQKRTKERHNVHTKD